MKKRMNGSIMGHRIAIGGAIKRIRMIKPNGPMRLIASAPLGGRNAASTLLPSSGGMGSRLKTISKQLKYMPAWQTLMIQAFVGAPDEIVAAPSRVATT